MKSKVRAAKQKRGSKKESRVKLLDAAEALIRSGGVSSVSSVSVTKNAGFTQSAFYLHFTNVDDCLRAAGERIAKQIRTSVAEDRRRVQRDALGDLEAETELFAGVLNIFTEERAVAEIMLWNRFDRSALGHCMRDLINSVRSDLVADLWEIAAQNGVRRNNRARVEIISDFILSNTLAAGEALLEGRVDDPDLLASELAATTQIVFGDLLRRCIDGGASRASSCGTNTAG